MPSRPAPRCAAPPLRASRAIHFVARKEFDYAIRDVAEGRPLETIDGLSYRSGERIVHRPERAPIQNMGRHPHTGKRNLAAIAASRYPIE